jgi:hypothetical protein
MSDERFERIEERVAWLEHHVTQQDRAMLELAERLDRVVRDELVGGRARHRQEDDVLDATLERDVDEREQRRLHACDGGRANEKERAARRARPRERVVAFVVEDRRFDPVAVQHLHGREREVGRTDRLPPREQRAHDLTADVARCAGDDDGLELARHHLRHCTGRAASPHSETSRTTRELERPVRSRDDA